MAVSLRSLALRRAVAAPRAQSSITITRSFTTSTTLNEENKPTYPFNRPPNPVHKPADAASRSPYPFTTPSDKQPPTPTKVSPPTRPVGTGPDPSTSVETNSTASNQNPTRSAASSMPHQPDYDVARDYRTSAFSPLPTRVMDGSEPGDLTAAAVLSGAPTELQARTVRIFQPAKTATQSGDWHAHHWQMDWDVLGKGHRWENPLIGWQSSADFMQATHLNFKSKDDAIRFAEKQGYEYYVQEPNERRFLPKAYATQFTHIPKKLKTIRTK